MMMEVSARWWAKAAVAAAHYDIAKPIKRRNASKPPLSRVPVEAPGG